jgi:hypothetical protein
MLGDSGTSNLLPVRVCRGVLFLDVAVAAAETQPHVCPAHYGLLSVAFCQNKLFSSGSDQVYRLAARHLALTMPPKQHSLP